MKEDPCPKRRRIEAGATRVLGRQEYLEKLKAVLDPMAHVAAMYNSLVDGVVVDKELMVMPIHDHAIVRGHAVFDTCSVSNGRLWRLDIHLDRHLESIQRAKIPLPFGKTAEECKDRMRTIVAQTVVASKLRDAAVRYYTSAGPGNFGVLPDGCTPSFYVCVMPLAGGPVRDADLKGVREYTVDVPLKPGMLATTKSNNYMLNVLTAMASHEKGGRYGILLDSDGNIAESCVMNCVFVTEDRRLITPPFAGILAGTTVRNLMRLASKLIDEGLLASVSQESVPAATARACVEMLLTGGDSHIVPVTHWDDRAVGDGAVGPVTRRLIQLVGEDAESGGDDYYELTYS